jgi:uncharacterized membrane protein (UPF0127 family)
LPIENPPFFAQCGDVKWLVLMSVLLAGLAAHGCKPAAPPPPAGPALPTEAQPKLPTIKLWMGSAEMSAEMALTAWQQRTGMMFRTNLAENEGMLFPFGQPERASFWMMNTLVPLSAAYISAAGEILEIHDLQPRDTNAVTAASDNILYVLETPQGWFTRNHVGTGAIVTTDRGSLGKVFHNQ